MFSALLLSLSFFVTDVFSLEIELQKESERIQESMGWITPEKLSYQEQMQVIIDQYNFCEALGKSGKEPVLVLRDL